MEAALQGCEVCLMYNYPSPKDPASTPEIPTEDLQAMEEIGLHIMSWGGRSYLVCADRATSYTMVTDLGMKSSAKEVAKKVGNTFAIFGLPDRVRFDRGLHFRVEFLDLLKECNIPTTPSSPYNSEANGLAEQHVGITKMLLKKCQAAKEDYMVMISAMNATTRVLGFSPAEMFLKQRVRTLLPDIRGQPDLQTVSQKMGERSLRMRENLRKHKARPALETGKIVLLHEETGTRKGTFLRECKVISRQNHGKSYFV